MKRGTKRESSPHPSKMEDSLGCFESWRGQRSRVPAEHRFDYPATSTLFTIFGNTLASKHALRSSPLFKDPPVYQRFSSVSDAPTAVYPSACSSVLKTCQYVEVRVEGFARVPGGKRRVDARARGKRKSGKEEEGKRGEGETRAGARHTIHGVVRCVYSVFPMKQLLFCGRRVQRRDTPLEWKGSVG